jgi:K+/H+ antiporter YhaU regulatory subunit KhtT
LILPVAETVIKSQDQMVVIGTQDDIDRAKDQMGMSSSRYGGEGSFETT